jgi:hypothetical protein
MSARWRNCIKERQMCQRYLSNHRHAFDQNMVAGQQADDQPHYQALLADDELIYLSQQKY